MEKFIFIIIKKSDYLKKIALINNVCSLHYNQKGEFESDVNLHVVFFFSVFITLKRKKPTSE